MSCGEKKSGDDVKLGREGAAPCQKPSALSGRRQVAATARAVSYVGIMAAVLECAKLVLAAVPNVEVVTLFVAVFSAAFGYLGVLATLVFVSIEPLIWGFGSWVISYYLYWPALAVVFALVFRRGREGIVLPTAIAAVSTLWFGVLSSLVDVGLFSGAFDNFFYRFGIYYLRGVWFYVTQLLCNIVLFPLLFRPALRLLRRISLRI